jgi:adenine specific DNA methylase Mod
MKNNIEYINQYLIGDNLEILKNIPHTYDLCYIDPPYNTGRDFGDFGDSFESMQHFLDFLKPRLQEIYLKLSESGNIIVHIDSIASHYVKILLDSIFGIKNFRNELIWITSNQKSVKNKLMRQHDVLLIYSKNKNKAIFNRILLPYNLDYVKKAKEDSNGKYTTSAAVNSQPNVIQRPNLRYEWNGHMKQWWVSVEKMQELHNSNRLEYNSAGIPRIKRYLHESGGIPLKDVWNDISTIQMNEKLDYATQKPVALLERIVNLYSNENSNCLDIFAGSGTLGRACLNTNRFYTLIDMNEKGKEIFEISKQNTILKFT